MTTVGWNLLVLSFASFASAQVSNECSAPPEYPNIRLLSKYTGVQKFSSGEKVQHNCAEGFAPHRGSRVAQCVGGTWTRLTLKCEKRSCGYVGDLLYGEFLYKGNSFIGEKVYARCKEGYTLRGLDYMICKKSGWAGDLPSCVVAEDTCSAPAVANSVNGTGDVSVHRVGDRVTVACRRGFLLAGARHIACGPGGLWQPPPPRCQPASEKKSGRRDRRCVEGQWTPMLLRCQRRLCGSAGEILNGLFTYTGVAFGDTATAVCSEGHRLVGRATRNCLTKGWDGRVPACEEITCAAPKVANAYWTGGHATYKDRDSVFIGCDAGFTRTGPSAVSCGRDGQWSPDLPKCTRK
ncbi:C4b-binding protein [Liparis tanakae]|uniref:C4b-binding protein n=1 Tax=Liparis tanakae TaxID=230148 RepID=A0A4Z2I526_9TELE|nr:C4b-binding protein [Liparis tanakae]